MIDFKLTTTDHATDHATDLRAPEWSFAPPLLRRGASDHDPDHCAASPALRVSNFEAATIAALVQLRGIDAEIEKLEATRADLRADLRQALIAGGSEPFEAEGVGEASIVSGRVAVETVDAKLIPDRFLKTVVDTAAAAKALKAGGDVPGLRLGEPGEPTLRIVWAKP